MMEDEQNERSEQKPSTVALLIKTMAILFVLAIYGAIFLKILFLK
jgi:hypothetical protein